MNLCSIFLILCSKLHRYASEIFPCCSATPVKLFPITRITKSQKLRHLLYFVVFFSYFLGFTYKVWASRSTMADELMQEVIEIVDTAKKHRLELEELLESLNQAKSQVCHNNEGCVKPVYIF